MSIADAMRTLAAKEIADVKRGWSKYHADGNASITFTITKETPDIVEGEYRAEGMKMWMLEYGSGSLMDKSNPLLEKYLINNLYNMRYNWRRGQAPKGGSDPSGTEIRTRPKGTYYDLDGKPHEGSGVGYSNNWQWGLNAEWLRGGNAVKPVAPHHIIKDIIPRRDTVHKQQFKEDLAKCMARMFRGVMGK